MHQLEANKKPLLQGVEYDPHAAVRALESRTSMYWLISSCFHNRVDVATCATMTVSKANTRLTAIKKNTLPTSRIHKVCARLHKEIIYNNAN